MGLSETDTRAKLIDPAIHARGWTEDFIRRRAIRLNPNMYALASIRFWGESILGVT
jgi:type I site-specific restriction endonuclease